MIDMALVTHRDRAAVMASAIVLIVRSAHNDADLVAQLIGYLRDEFHDIAQQIRNEIRTD